MNKLSILLLIFSSLLSLSKSLVAAFFLDLSNFGQYSISIAFVTLFTLLISFSIEPIYIRTCSRVKILTSNIFAEKALLVKFKGFLIINFLLLFLPFFLLIFLYYNNVTVSFVIILISLLTSVFNLSVSYYRLVGNFKLYSYFLLLKSSLLILFFVVVSFFTKDYFYFILVDFLILFLLVFFLTYDNFKLIKLRIILVKHYFRIVKSGYGYSFSYFIRTGLVMLDRPLVGFVHGSTIAGLYALYLIPMQVALGVFGLFSVYIQPWAIRKKNAGKNSEILKLINIYVFLITIFSCFLFVFVFVLPYFVDISHYRFNNLFNNLLSIAIACLVLINVFDSFFIVFNKGDVQLQLTIFTSVIFLFGLIYFYCNNLHITYLLFMVFFVKLIYFLSSWFVMRRYFMKRISNL